MKGTKIGRTGLFVAVAALLLGAFAWSTQDSPFERDEDVIVLKANWPPGLEVKVTWSVNGHPATDEGRDAGSWDRTEVVRAPRANVVLEVHPRTRVDGAKIECEIWMGTQEPRKATNSGLYKPCIVSAAR